MQQQPVRNQHEDQRYAVSPSEAARRAGLGRTTIYGALKIGDLKSIKVGARRLIMVDELKRWLVSHETA